MGIDLVGKVGLQAGGLGNGVSAPEALDNFGGVYVSEAMPRFWGLANLGLVYSAGLSALTSIASATFSTADLLSGTLGTAATGTPIIGLWNPLANNVNAIVIQANLQLINTALQETGPGAFMWCVFTGQQAITVANQQSPVNHKTFLQSGSNMKGLCTIALTGLTTTGVFLRAANFSTPISNVSTLQTAAGLIPTFGQQVDQIDGQIIVPPGGILALACTSTPVAYSAVPSITWAEVPFF